jgi:regulator of sirC expression with transglutaminase-like and TPR domain
MPSPKLSTRRQNVLRRLLDDSSVAVFAALKEELGRYGEAGIEFLQQESRTSDLKRRRQVMGLLRELAPGYEAIRQFQELIRSFQYELETGAYFVERVVAPDNDPSLATLELDRLGQRCRELAVLPCRSWDICKLINRIIFHEEAYRVDPRAEERPETSLLGAIIRERRGSALALSALYVLIGRRCGLDLEVVATPGSFLVGCFAEDIPFYIDVVEQGRFISAEMLFHSIATVLSNEEEALRLMAPSPTGEVLCVLCRQLARQFQRAGDSDSSELFTSFVEAFEDAYRREDSA